MAEPMRIMHLTDLYPPVSGGLETQLAALCQELAARGHQVDVVTLARDGVKREDLESGVLVHRVTGWSRVLRPLYEDPRRPFHPTIPDPGMTATLARILKRRRPQVVHGHSWIVFSALPLLPSKETALVLGLHDFGFICAKKTLIRHGRVCDGPALGKCLACAAGQYGIPRSAALTITLAAMRRWPRKSDRIVANGRAVAEACSQLVRRDAHPVELVPPFLAQEVLAGLLGPRPRFVPAEGEYIMFAGGASPHKGLPVLLEAWQRLSHPPPLVVAGLSREGTPYPIPPEVIVAGQVPHGDVLRAWAHCAIGVVPSVWPEPFGLVALEVMAAGRALVAARSGNLAELVSDGVTGLLVDPGDVGQLSGALAKLLSSPELRSALGAAAKMKAQEYTADAVVPRMEGIYRGAIEGRAGLPGHRP